MQPPSMQPCLLCCSVIDRIPRISVTECEEGHILCMAMCPGRVGMPGGVGTLDVGYEYKWLYGNGCGGGWGACLPDSYWLCCDRFPILLRRIRLMELTDGRLNLSQTPSASSLSRISQAKIPGSLCLYVRMCLTTVGVVTRGLLPPMAPGRMEPVSL